MALAKRSLNCPLLPSSPLPASYPRGGGGFRAGAPHGYGGYGSKDRLRGSKPKPL